MLQTVRGDGENFKSCQSYFPHGMEGVLSRPNVTVIGAAQDQTAIGVMAVETEQKAATILWMFITEENRRRGAASMLLRDVSDASRKEGFREIRAAFSEDDGAPALTALLEKNGFQCFPVEEAGIEMCGLFEINLDALMRFKMDHVLPLEGISDYDLKMFGSGLPDSLKDTLELPLLKAGYDPCSTAIQENGALTGVCLMKKISETHLQLCVFHAQKNPADLPSMLAAAAESARKAYPPGTRLSIVTEDEKEACLFQKLDPGAKRIRLYEARKILEGEI